MLKLSEYEKSIEFSYALGVDPFEGNSESNPRKRISFPPLTETKKKSNNKIDLFEEITEEGGFVRYELKTRKNNV